ncbi:MAG: hypothetical protein GVY36_11990 [Verrucomicrobia bacterium]|jgi:hypothetical protein|nr:hypothetical protein [Verrucomicrobiota bacterium]
MQRADFKVVIDACVLANFRVCDVLLTLAESPRLFLPRWSQQILDETRRTQINKLGWSETVADSFRAEVDVHFPEARVEGFEHLIDQCTNEAKFSNWPATSKRRSRRQPSTCNSILRIPV